MGLSSSSLSPRIHDPHMEGLYSSKHHTKLKQRELFITSSSKNLRKYEIHMYKSYLWWALKTFLALIGAVKIINTLAEVLLG